MQSLLRHIFANITMLPPSCGWDIFYGMLGRFIHLLKVYHHRTILSAQNPNMPGSNNKLGGGEHGTGEGALVENLGLCQSTTKPGGGVGATEEGAFGNHAHLFYAHLRSAACHFPEVYEYVEALSTTDGDLLLDSFDDVNPEYNPEFTVEQKEHSVPFTGGCSHRFCPPPQLNEDD
jgi:hypothetical protein